jgi:hypothetical protein
MLSILAPSQFMPYARLLVPDPIAVDQLHIIITSYLPYNKIIYLDILIESLISDRIVIFPGKLVQY